MCNKKITSFLVFLIFFGLACSVSVDLGGVGSAPLTPTFTMLAISTSVPTLTTLPSATPTVTPPSRFRIIPSDYYRIVTSKYITYEGSRQTTVCVITKTSKASTMIDDEIAELVATREVKSIEGDCSHLKNESQPKIQINIYTGAISQVTEDNINPNTIDTYFGKDFQADKEDIFTHTGISIPVWNFRRAENNSAVANHYVVWKGTSDYLIDQKTGIVVYRFTIFINADNSRYKNTQEIIGLTTNAPIGGIQGEFSYEKK